MSDTITNMANILAGSTARNVSKSQYEQFQQQWIFDALKGLRYGQAFCEYFSIGNGTPLYFFKDNKICETWINDNYIVK